jgi:hypothetical protein
MSFNVLRAGGRSKKTATISSDVRRDPGVAAARLPPGAKAR